MSFSGLDLAELHKQRMGRALPTLFKQGDVELETFPSLHLGGHVWDAAVVLSHFLCSPAGASLISGKALVELGCGVGLLGITAARHAASVLLTDIGEELLAVVARNIKRNAVDDNCSCSELRWGATVERVEIFIGSDIIYDRRTFDDLVLTLTQSGAHALLIAYQERAPLEEAEFFELLARGGWRMSVVHQEGKVAVFHFTL